jgi:hypothetical protein
VVEFKLELLGTLGTTQLYIPESFLGDRPPPLIFRLEAPSLGSVVQTLLAGNLQLGESVIQLSLRGCLGIGRVPKPPDDRLPVKNETLLWLALRPNSDSGGGANLGDFVPLPTTASDDIIQTIRTLLNLSGICVRKADVVTASAADQTANFLQPGSTGNTLLLRQAAGTEDRIMLLKNESTVVVDSKSVLALEAVFQPFGLKIGSARFAISLNTGKFSGEFNIPLIDVPINVNMQLIQLFSAKLMLSFVLTDVGASVALSVNMELQITTPLVQTPRFTTGAKVVLAEQPMVVLDALQIGDWFNPFAEARKNEFLRVLALPLPSLQIKDASAQLSIAPEQWVQIATAVRPADPSKNDGQGSDAGLTLSNWPANAVTRLALRMPCNPSAPSVNNMLIYIQFDTLSLRYL